MAHQGIDFRGPAAEGRKAFDSITTAAGGKDFIAPTPSRFGVKEPGFFKSGKGIGRKHLSPLVTVVTGCVSAGEDMGKRLRKAVVFFVGSHGNKMSNVPQNLGIVRVLFRVNAHVKERKFQLP